MNLHLGIKSDPVEYRYSYEWLFGLMRELGISYLQLGSSFEFYQVEDSYFADLRKQAESYGVRIFSCFTAHRELGGFFTGDPRMERVARRNYERWIEIGSIVGAEYVGSNPGAVFRDRPDTKTHGSAVFLEHLMELMHHGMRAGISSLAVEPMSSSFEPPSLPDEIDSYMETTRRYHKAHPSETVPVHFCGDISHGIADAKQNISHTHWELFEQELPHMAEFHFKNTDSIYNSTFGFGEADRKRGIIDLQELRTILEQRESDIPVRTFVGYLEIGGPKLGRDYSDPLLRTQLVDSIEHIRSVFPEL